MVSFGDEKKQAVGPPGLLGPVPCNVFINDLEKEVAKSANDAK